MNQRHLPPGTGTFGMMLFLLSLTVLFIAGIAAYALIRITGNQAPPPGTLDMPVLLWGSTIIVLLSSVTAQFALSSLQRERQGNFRRGLILTLGLAILFLFVQGPALYDLLATHNDADVSTRLYGLVFCLIVLHALHVVGGIIPLVITTINAHRARYDHENANPVKYVVMYWHFLDLIWVVMFSALLLLA